ncbi:MAG TPA: hypothetical protein VMS93_02515 [Candidatus Saccharimonadales bacterium]|nr:hypothetical protein [Candidatus Saccharimonadales bacterium]
MRKTDLILALAAALAVGCGGCNDFSPVVGPPVSYPYISMSNPESVLVNLRASYINRDAAEYDRILTSDYVFRFAPVDIVPGQPDSLLRGDEMSFAQNLFHDGKPAQNLPRASQASLVFTIQSRDLDNRVGHAGWQKYVASTDLTLHFVDGNTTRVTGLEWFYFKPEPAGSGTWKLAEWDDRGASLGVPAGVRSLKPQPANVVTWGKLKRLYH